MDGFRVEQEVPAAQTDAATEHTKSLFTTSAQVLTVDPGMYAVDLHAQGPLGRVTSIVFPCARLDALPPSRELPGRAVVSLMGTSDWLGAGELPALIRVVDGQAGIMLTIYRLTDTPAPELRVRFVRDDLAFSPEAATAAPAADTMSPPSPFQVLAHVQERGDIRAAAGDWIGEPGSARLIEGFEIVADSHAELAPGELEYQAVLGEGWNTPWFAAGEFCGSRGLALPILGLRVRLLGRIAERYECQIWGHFAGGGEAGPMGNGEVCESGGQPMEAVKIAFIEKEPPIGTAPPPIEPQRRKSKL